MQTYTEYELTEIKNKLMAAQVARRLQGVIGPINTKPVRTKTLSGRYKAIVEDKPNFHKSGSIRGMKKHYYGTGALLVRCGNYIYNVTDEPTIYYQFAHD